MSSSRPLPSSDASRPRSGILTLSSDASLNRSHDAALSDSRKRKHEEEHPMEDLLKPSMVVKPHPQNLAAKPRILQPIMVVFREDLPLSSLDLSAPHCDLPSSHLFESRARILELESRVGSRPAVLIARNESTGHVYAVERNCDGLYSVCKLGSWVDLEALSIRATVCSWRLLRPAVQEEPKGNDLAVPLTTPKLHKANKEKRIAIEAIQSLVRKRARSQSVSTFEEATGLLRLPEPSSANPRAQTTNVIPCLAENVESSETQVASEEGEDSQVIPEPEHLAQPTAESMFESIRSQYVDALYRSMGSLAYFAKGPLSRARAAFHLDCDSSLNMNDLVDFLKSLIMTTVQIDTKYRDSIPGIIATMKTLVDSSDDQKKKKRKSRKMKLGKDGMYPLEDEHVRRWWNANKPDLQEDDRAISPQQIKSHVALLRARETQLQMIVILEILALEPLITGDDAESQLPGEPSAAMPPPPKKRGKHNLPVLVDVHADRLCIWQSTASDEQRLLEDSHHATVAEDGQRVQKPSSELLKDFCVDIIMPFFCARLPELCNSINRKLGGPTIVSPPTVKQPKRPEPIKKDPKPGASVKRPGQAKPQRTLQRALSNEQYSRRSVSRGPSNAIALMRSATSTTIPRLKREGSEPPLKSIPQGQPGLLTEKPINLSSRSNSVASSDDTKAQKRAMVEAELQNAISVLRKPNRKLAGETLVEAAERRVSGSLSQIRKSKKPTRHPLFQSVQVKATPANNRFRDALSSASQRGAKGLELPQIFADDDGIPPSSALVVPSTAPRRSHRDALVVVSPIANAVQATPARGSGTAKSSLTRLAVEEPAITPSSPLMARKFCAPRHLDVPRSVIQDDVGSTPTKRVDNYPLFETPVKLRVNMEKETTASDSKIGQSVVGVEQKRMSIYEKLGWDDDD